MQKSGQSNNGRNQDEGPGTCEHHLLFRGSHCACVVVHDEPLSMFGAICSVSTFRQRLEREAQVFSMRRTTAHQGETITKWYKLQMGFSKK